jgi:hypothetical protein
MMAPGKSWAQYGKDFYDWLIQQLWRNDPVGDLAAELRRDNVPPPEDYDKFRAYILHRAGGGQAYDEWLDYAWQAEPQGSRESPVVTGPQRAQEAYGQQ